MSLVFNTSCGNTKELDSSAAWSVSLSKSGCMDVCDSYEILIESSGSYIYNGIHNVKHIGKKSGEIPKDKLLQIQTITENLDWFNLESEYGKPGPGAQRKELIYIKGLESKSIVYYRMEPQDLRNLEQIIDQIIDNDEL